MIIETAQLAPSTPVRAAQSPRLRRRLLTWTSWGYVAVMIALWAAMRELGDRWWPGTLLLLGPRWPYALPLALLWPWTVAVRAWRSVVACAAATAIVAFLVMGFHVALPGGDSQRGSLRLLTCNIHRQHLDAARMAEYLAAVKPDVVALQGWSDLHQDSLFVEPGWEIKRYGELLLASRFPLGESVSLEVSDNEPDVPAGEQGAAGLFEIRMPQGSIHLVSLHLASPHAGLVSMWKDRGEKLAGNVERRWRESARLRGFVEHIQGTLLLAGDFNTVSESPLLREHWEGFSDAFSEAGTGLGYTYLINHTQIRIDHILADQSCRILRCWVGPDVSAAHRPLVADIEFR